MTKQPASDDRRGVERVLAGEGLLGGPRRVGAAPAPEETEDFAPRLRRACERLGPSFALFARYLGSRLDLLPAGDCAALAACPIAVFQARRRDGLLFVELVDRDLLAGLAELPALVVVGALGTVSWLCVTRAFALVDASVVMPFEFARLPLTALAGYLLFAEVPTLWTWLGGAVIFASTVYITHREIRASASTPAGAGTDSDRVQTTS